MDAGECMLSFVFFDVAAAASLPDFWRVLLLRGDFETPSFILSKLQDHCKREAKRRASQGRATYDHHLCSVFRRSVGEIRSCLKRKMHVALKDEQIKQTRRYQCADGIIVIAP